MKQHFLHAPRQLAAGSLLLVGALLAAALGPGLPVFSAPLQVTVPSTLGFEGYLADANGDPVADGAYDLAFKLWNAAEDGTQIGLTENKTDVAVSGGLYTVELTTFTASSFDGSRWLGITATGGPTTVNGGNEIVPRTRITSVPFALNAQTANSADAVAWSGVNGIPAGFADGVDNNTTYSAGTGLDLTSTTFSVTSSYRLPQSCTNNQIAKWNASQLAWTCQADSGVTGSGSNGQLALWGASGLTSNAGLTYASNNLSVTGGLNLGSASGAGTGSIKLSGSIQESVPIGARAYHNTSQDVTSGSSWRFAPSTEVSDLPTGGMFANGQSYFLCTTAGYYSTGASVGVGSVDEAGRRMTLTVEVRNSSDSVVVTVAGMGTSSVSGFINYLNIATGTFYCDQNQRVSITFFNGLASDTVTIQSASSTNHQYASMWIARLP